MSQDEERAAMRAAVETGAVSVGEYVAKYGSEPALPNDTRQAELQAALARVEAAEAVFADLCAELACAQDNEIALQAIADLKRQRDEAFTAGAEAMREACVTQCLNMAGGFDTVRCAAAIRRLPLPQEAK